MVAVFISLYAMCLLINNCLLEKNVYSLFGKLIEFVCVVCHQTSPPLVLLLMRERRVQCEIHLFGPIYFNLYTVVCLSVYVDVG